MMRSELPGAPAPGPRASGPHRTHPLTAVTGFVAFGLGLVLVATASGLGFDLIITIFGGLSLIRWWFRTYEVGPDELIVRDGVLSRRIQVVPYRRVQQVDIRRSLFMQIFGLAALRIETAGSQAGTVDLAMLSAPTAESLRTWVLARRAAPAPQSEGSTAFVPAPPAPEEVLHALGIGRLFLAGVTAPAVALSLAVAVATVPAAIAFAVWSGLNALAVPAAFMFLAAVIAAISVIASVLTYAGYELSRAGDEMRLSHGALEQRHVTMPIARVQYIEISDNPLRRAFGIASVSIRSAAQIGAVGQSGRVEIPIVDRTEVSGLLAALMGDQSWTPPPLHPRPPAARRRGIVRRTAPILAIAAIVLAFEPVAGVVVAACALGGFAWGVVAHRRAGYAVTPAIAVFAAGVVLHRLHLVPIERIQSARAVQSPFQRRAGLTTLALDIAGSAGAPGLYDLDVPTATTLRRELPRARGPERAGATASPRSFPSSRTPRGREGGT